MLSVFNLLTSPALGEKVWPLDHNVDATNLKLNLNDTLHLGWLVQSKLYLHMHTFKVKHPQPHVHSPSSIHQLMNIQGQITTTRVSLDHGLINYIDSKGKFRHLKIFTCKGNSRQVFIRVYGPYIQSVMLVLSTQLCELLPLSTSLWFNSPSSPFPVVYCVHVYSV